MKILIFHPGKQHSFYLARELNEKGYLCKYVTTVYNKQGSLTRALMKFLPKKERARIATHTCEGLKDNQVIQFGEILGLINTLLSRCRNKKLYDGWNQFVNDYCGRKVAKYAIMNNVDAVISYNNNSNKVFSILKEKAPNIKRILDASAANVVYMRQIYEKDFKKSPDYRNKLYLERSRLWDEKYILKMKNETALSQYFLVGSTFVKKSYEYSGVLPEQIYICPYGVDIQRFVYKERKMVDYHSPLNFVFIGGTKELKGISYLLEAFLEIPIEKASLTVIGENTLPDNLKNRYNERVKFTGIILNTEVANLLQNMDVMIFPSLGEGFALSIMEALASGVPVIASENSGSSDVIKDGINGYVIPIQDKAAIINKVEWFISHHDKIPEMGYEARRTAEQYTWKEYGRRVIDSIEEIKRNGKSSL